MTRTFCINCGTVALPNASDCHYCLTPLDYQEPRANRRAFYKLLATIGAMQNTTSMYLEVTDFRGPLTAGQARQVLSMFARNEAHMLRVALPLIRLAVDRKGLRACGDVFRDPAMRVRFVELLDQEDASEDLLKRLESEIPAVPKPRNLTPVFLGLAGAALFAFGWVVGRLVIPLL